MAFWNRGKAKLAAEPVEKALTPANSGWRTIFESFTGAWQRNAELKRGEKLTYPTLYACLFRISSDIGKLPFLLKHLDGGIWRAVESPAYSPVLRKPNHYQTAAQFREHWMLMKLVHGNAYILKRRDNRGVVTALYVLDSSRVLPMVSDAGHVFYQLYTDALNTLPADYPAEHLVVPASEIIHDRCQTLFHPLIGIPPVAAASWPAAKNFKVLRTADQFFANGAQVSGILTAPENLKDEQAKRLAEEWKRFSREDAGKIAVIGADMKFVPFAMKGVDAQVVEHLRYSDEQICQPFGVPPFKIGIGTLPTGMGVDGVNQLYYGDALQSHMEMMEGLLWAGLGMKPEYKVDLDLGPLLRMDVGKQAEVETKLVREKVKTPDESRSVFNLPPTPGGDTLWGQHQDYPLGVLASRSDVGDPAPEAPQLSDDDKAVVNEAKAFVMTQRAIQSARAATRKANAL